MPDYQKKELNLIKIDLNLKDVIRENYNLGPIKDQQEMMESNTNPLYLANDDHSFVIPQEHEADLDDMEEVKSQTGI